MSEKIDLIRKYPMNRSLDTVARELFNALGQAKEWEVTKTPEQNSYIFTVKRKEKLISKLTPTRFLVRLSEEQGYCVVHFENQDQEPVSLKYVKSYFVAGIVGITVVREQLEEISRFPDFIESLLKKILAL